ncbi:MAG: hypothetical protein PHP26_04825 [Syntrophomonas sp.]|nr:hypothetical protein [Syntrophomonas sp.]
MSQKNSIELPDDVMSLVEAYEEAKRAEDEAVRLKDLAANQLKALLGENECGIIQNRKVFWKTVNTDRFDSTSFKADHPALYAEYVQPSTYRRFTVK